MTYWGTWALRSSTTATRNERLAVGRAIAVRNFGTGRRNSASPSVRPHRALENARISVPVDVSSRLAQLLPLEVASINVFRAALVSVVLTLAIGQNAGLLCKALVSRRHIEVVPASGLDDVAERARRRHLPTSWSEPSRLSARTVGARSWPGLPERSRCSSVPIRRPTNPTRASAMSRGSGCCSKNDLFRSPSESKSLRRSRPTRPSSRGAVPDHTRDVLRVRIAQARQTQIRCDFGHQRGWSVMRTVHFRSLSLAAVAALTFAASGAAQDRAPGLLNNLEVQQLVARAEPGDQAQLSAHFTALADRYAAEAKRHISMSQSFIGNPSRNLGTGMSAHCKQLANLNTQSETTVRELAAYHAKLARCCGNAAERRAPGSRAEPEHRSRLRRS